MPPAFRPRCQCHENNTAHITSERLVDEDITRLSELRPAFSAEARREAIPNGLPAYLARDVTIISPESIDAPQANERNTVLVIIAGICLSALVISYVGYCFYETSEKIKETSDRLGINLQ
jgi:hypothetical protein